MLDNQYFKKYLTDRNIDLSQHIEIEKLCTLDINPKEFEHFKPACQSEELAKCSDEEIINAYDNSILYTDFFLKSRSHASLR